MDRKGFFKGQARLILGWFSVTLLGSGLAAGSDLAHQADSPAFGIYIKHKHTAIAVRRALEATHEKLAEPRCQGVFSEFYDLSGRPLQEVLDSLGRTAQGHLESLTFRDGSRSPMCKNRGILAFTSPGNPLVFVCSKQFRERALRYRALIRATLIHEALHTLGLGENPPSAEEITSRVIARCGG